MLLVKKYTCYPSNWDQSAKIDVDQFTVDIESRPQGWIIRLGYLHWSPVHNDWRNTYNGYNGKPPDKSAYFRDFSEAESQAQYLTDTRTNWRGDTYDDLLTRLGGLDD